MKEVYLVYADRQRQGIEILVYSLFIAGLSWVSFTRKPHIVLLICIIIFQVLLCIPLLTNIKKIRHQILLYAIDRNGIKDYTSKKEEKFLKWSDISRIELSSNNTSLQIGILASDIISDRKKMSQAIQDNMLQNGNAAFYSIIIDGFQFRKKVFKQIFEEMKKFAKQENPSIYIDEFKDPLQRKRMEA